MNDHFVSKSSSGMGTPDMTFGNSDFRLSLKKISEDEVMVRLAIRRDKIRKVKWESDDHRVEVIASVNALNDPYNGYLSTSELRCVKKVDRDCRRNGGRMYTITINNELEYIFEDGVDGPIYNSEGNLIGYGDRNNRKVKKSVTSYHKEMYQITIYESVIARLV